MIAPRTTGNRTTLAIAGLVLLVGGAWPVGSWSPIADRLPAGWPRPPAGGRLLDRTALADLRSHVWWTPAVITAGVLVTVLLARWLLAQLHVGRPSRLRLAVAHTSLRTQALEEALTERAEGIDGIGRCRARVHPRRRSERLLVRVRVWLEPGAAPDTVIGQLTALTAEAEAAAAPYRIETRLRLSHITHGAPHVH
ncbi:hypothetical protein ACGFXC_36330 [Streptomyces sp. NPDC048507]|uniref:hypothetical protein n=1 Tax=Streptomyces sp. NPDC048507 TaxID=3365560 RepID=UPI00371E2D41